MVRRAEKLVVRQYDICQNKLTSSRKQIPYFVILQTNFLSSLATVIVAPLFPENEANKIMKLNPAVEVSGKIYRVSMADMAGIPKLTLGETIMNVDSQHSDFIAAIDFLFTGF